MDIDKLEATQRVCVLLAGESALTSVDLVNE